MGLFKKKNVESKPLPPELPPLPPLEPPMPAQDKIAPPKPEKLPENIEKLEFPEIPKENEEELPPFPKIPPKQEPETNKEQEKEELKRRVERLEERQFIEAKQEIEETEKRKNFQKPLFIKMDDFKIVLRYLNEIKLEIKDGDSTSEKILEIYKQENKKFDVWQNQLKDIQRKLLFIDKSLFEIKHV